MFNKKEYLRKWQRENKDKVVEYNKRWQEKNPEKAKAIQEKWRKNNLDKVREYNKKSYEKFKSTHNWSKYCAERKKARIQRLREQGVKNPWSVLNGKEAKYREEKDEYTMQ